MDREIDKTQRIDKKWKSKIKAHKKRKHWNSDPRNIIRLDYKSK